MIQRVERPAVTSLPAPVSLLFCLSILLLAVLATAISTAGLEQAAPVAALEFETSQGPLAVYPVGHGSPYLTFRGITVHIDPYSQVADYRTLPKADQIWITHDHADHLDRSAIAAVSAEKTVIVADRVSAARIRDLGAIALANGDRIELDGIIIEAVPAYNLVRERAPGQKYHPKGQYNGYIATFGDFRMYVAGDTECFPEMSQFGPIDLAFIPINLPFTMPPEEAVGCIKVISPKVVVPYHQGSSDPNVVATGLANSGIEVIVLPLP